MAFDFDAVMEKADSQIYGTLSNVDVFIDSIKVGRGIYDAEGAVTDIPGGGRIERTDAKLSMREIDAEGINRRTVLTLETKSGHQLEYQVKDSFPQYDGEIFFQLSKVNRSDEQSTKPSIQY